MVETSAHIAAASLPQPDAPLRVLVVEDDPDLGSALEEYLKLSGLAVDWARSALEFYSMLGAVADYDVAVIDLGLPDQPGLVLGEYMRRNTLCSVIILTANDSPERSAESYASGMDLFITKPVDNEVLLAAINSMAQRCRQRRALEAAVSAAPGVELSVGRRASPAAATPPGWRLDTQRRCLLAPDGTVIDLARQEATILMLLAQGEDQTASRRHQVSVLYGREDHSAQRALDAQISRLRRKITEVTGRDAPIVTDYGIGHRFSERLILIA